MKNSAYLINLARGAIVDHEALVVALDAGELAGAGLDILQKSRWILTACSGCIPKVLITHHTAPVRPIIWTGLRRWLRNIDATLPMSRCFMSRNADAEFLLLFYPFLSYPKN